LKKLISEDQIGKLEQIRTRRCNWTSPRKDVDPIWTLIPHDISILAELSGMVPKAEFAVAEYCNNKPVGMLAHLQATCACIAEVSSRYPEKIREIRVQGTKGTAILRDDGNVVQFYQGDETTDQPCLNNIHVEPQPALRLEIQAFLEYLRGGPPPKTRLNEAIEITRCLTQLRTMAGLTNG
jgi:predicted dehydrogenase